MKHFICVASKANVPSWAVSTRKILDDRILRKASFDAAGMIEPTIYAVPMMIAYKFGKQYIDNKHLQDEVILKLIESQYGVAPSDWVK